VVVSLATVIVPNSMTSDCQLFPAESDTMNHASTETDISCHPCMPGWRVAWPALALHLGTDPGALVTKPSMAMASYLAAFGHLCTRTSLSCRLTLVADLAETFKHRRYWRPDPQLSGRSLLFAGAGCAWLLGEFSAANVVSQFALTFMLVLASCLR
jgi:hypothetical protein